MEKYMISFQMSCVVVAISNVIWGMRWKELKEKVKVLEERLGIKEAEEGKKPDSGESSKNKH